MIFPGYLRVSYQSISAPNGVSQSFKFLAAINVFVLLEVNRTLSLVSNYFNKNFRLSIIVSFSKFMEFPIQKIL